MSEQDREIFAKTVFAEARGESPEGQTWVAWVIKNRAYKNRVGWGGGSIAGVCKKPYQFECWTGQRDIYVDGERGVYDRIRRQTDRIYDAPQSADPTGGADHYNNPDKETADWVPNVRVVKRIGNHVFYKE